MNLIYVYTTCNTIQLANFVRLYRVNYRKWIRIRARLSRSIETKLFGLKIIAEQSLRS